MNLEEYLKFLILQSMQLLWTVLSAIRKVISIELRKPVKLKTLYTAEMIRSITIAINNVSDILESRFGIRLKYSMPDDKLLHVTVSPFYTSDS